MRRYRFIRAARADWLLAVLCGVLRVARAGCNAKAGGGSATYPGRRAVGPADRGGVCRDSQHSRGAARPRRAAGDGRPQLPTPKRSRATSRRRGRIGCGSATDGARDRCADDDAARPSTSTDPRPPHRSRVPVHRRLSTSALRAWPHLLAESFFAALKVERVGASPGRHGRRRGWRPSRGSRPPTTGNAPTRRSPIGHPLHSRRLWCRVDPPRSPTLLAEGGNLSHDEGQRLGPVTLDDRDISAREIPVERGGAVTVTTVPVARLYVPTL